MLVLSRRLGESIKITTSDGPIIITVEKFTHGRIHLGLEASKSIKILRSELDDEDPIGTNQR